MKRTCLVLAFALCLFSGAARAAQESDSFGRFGILYLYSNSPHPSQVVLFISGDGGWNLGVVDMAKALADLDALVVGIDITHYLKQTAASKEACTYAAADFEALSKYIQKKHHYPTYMPPVIVGYSSGATLAYAVLAQSPPNTFQGAISLGFCPDLPLSKPLCKGQGLQWTAGPKGKGYSFLPAPKLPTPWIAFQGTIDKVCDADATQDYVKQIGCAEIVLLPKVGHGFSVEKNWMPQFKNSFAELIATPPVAVLAPVNELNELPLVEVPASKPESDVLAVIITGDGGWAGIDREIGDALAEHGVSVIGFNSLQYFWTRRTPEEAAKDLGRVLNYYLPAWHKSQALILGYSLGADVLPFMVSRLPQELRDRLSLLVLLGPAQNVDFEFHLTDWVGGESSTARPTLPEVEKLKGMNILCMFGAEESDSLCQKVPPTLTKVIPLGGSHHFGGNYSDIADQVLKELPPSQ
jgi:type IV secretory pathway VirJ component